MLAGRASFVVPAIRTGSRPVGCVWVVCVVAAELSRRSRYAQRVVDPRSRPFAMRRDGGVHVPDIQRSRLLAAAVGVVDELGYAGASVTHITERARVSRRTFYELFDNREECLVAVLEGAVARVTSEISGADLTGLPWRERVRGGLWVILSFFDREPALARVCVVRSQGAAQSVLARRQEILDGLASIVGEGGREGSGATRPVELTAQGIVGGVFSILYARLLRAHDERLCDLLGELMAMIVLPYQGQAAARREQTRPAPPPLSVAEGVGERLISPLGSVEPLAVLPMRLTYRTAMVLQALADHPGQSNRQVAGLVGISDQGQISKLLARLQRIGLLQNAADGAHDKGEANQWVLTNTGQQVTHSIQVHTGGVSGLSAPTVGAGNQQPRVSSSTITRRPVALDVLEINEAGQVEGG